MQTNGLFLSLNISLESQQKTNLCVIRTRARNSFKLVDNFPLRQIELRNVGERRSVWIGKISNKTSNVSLKFLKEWNTYSNTFTQNYQKTHYFRAACFSALVFACSCLPTFHIHSPKMYVFRAQMNFNCCGLWSMKCCAIIRHYTFEYSFPFTHIQYAKKAKIFLFVISDNSHPLGDDETIHVEDTKFLTLRDDYLCRR